MTSLAQRIEMVGITKRFPMVVANDNVNFTLEPGEIHGLLGENGAGKTTLMNILYGLSRPDEGDIYVQGTKAHFKSPKDARKCGIGMVSQHFTLIRPLTAIENIALPSIPCKHILFSDLKSAERSVEQIEQTYGMKVDLNAKIEDLSAGEQQQVEILKVLSQGPDVIILDEPTALLTPQENEVLYRACRVATERGQSVILITHKLREALAFTDRITILRQGQVVSTLVTKETDERQLARMMVKREIPLGITKSTRKLGPLLLETSNLETFSDKRVMAVKQVCLEVHGGEILGIAGVAGNGQRELVESVMGLRKSAAGKIVLCGEEITSLGPSMRREKGLTFIPEDRISDGVASACTIADNLLLGQEAKEPFSRYHVVHHDHIREYSEALVSKYEIMPQDVEALVTHLSGGNIQRVIVARELSRPTQVLVAFQPTRGLDVGMTEFVRQKLLELASLGKGILLVSYDLDEILALSDRIAVMYEGRIVGTIPTDEAKIDEIGLMMGGLAHGADQTAEAISGARGRA